MQTELNSIAIALSDILSQFKETAELLERDQQKQKWIPISKASHYLGEGITPWLIKERIRTGAFDHGVHYLNVATKDTPRYVICPREIENYFMTPPEYRD